MDTLYQCPLCATSNMSEVMSVEDHSISRESFVLCDCHACGFRFTNPRPIASDLGKYYNSETYVSHNSVSTRPRDKLYRIVRTWGLRRKRALIDRHASRGNVLDIGCGTGEFLAHLMSRGYTVQGVEPSLKAREQAIANYGIAVLPSVDQLQAHEQFQVITLWHVLEHVSDIREKLKTLYALLSENGLLVIAVPDRESWDAEHYASHWAAWDVPRHLSHFRRQDVHALLFEHGLKLLSTRKMWFDAYYIALLSEHYRGSGSFMAIIKALILGTWSNILALITARPTSSIMYLARKIEA